jgi:DNA modification methylase
MTMMPLGVQQGDCLQLLSSLPADTIPLAFCDPPYNIGFDYGGEYDDTMSASEYKRWSRSWLEQVHRVLHPHGTFWLAIGDEWAADLICEARSLGFHLRSWIIWYYTFGVNCDKKFTRSHAHLLYFTKHRTQFTFNANDIRVPSAREAVYRDKRAKPGGRLPDDTWILRPQQLPDAFSAEGDVWFIPRICGTHKQREPGMPTQMPEQLLGRIIRACSNPGDYVLDPMAGSGTSLAVAKKLGRRYLGYEQSAAFYQRARARVRGAREGDPLDGKVPQGG